MTRGRSRSRAGPGSRRTRGSPRGTGRRSDLDDRRERCACIQEAGCRGKWCSSSRSGCRDRGSRAASRRSPSDRLRRRRRTTCSDLIRRIKGRMDGREREEREDVVRLQVKMHGQEISGQGREAIDREERDGSLREGKSREGRQERKGIAPVKCSREIAAHLLLSQVARDMHTCIPKYLTRIFMPPLPPCMCLRVCVCMYCNLQPLLSSRRSLTLPASHSRHLALADSMNHEVCKEGSRVSSLSLTLSFPPPSLACLRASRACISIFARL